MSRSYIIESSRNDNNGFGLRQADFKYSVTLDAATEATLTVPGASFPGMTNRFIAIFSYEGTTNVYVSTSGTAEVPAGNTLVSTTSELRPHARTVNVSDVISVISATASTDVQISLYSL